MALGKGQVVSWYICTIVAVLFVAARLFVKYRRFATLTLDDGFILLAAACLIGDLAIQQYMWNEGMASIGTASRQEFINIMQMIIPGSILYVTSLWAIKVALVIFYKRIAARTELHTVYNYVLGALAITWAVIFFDIIFQCYPVDRKWTEDPTVNIVSDIIIISLPISMVMKLQMPMKQKLGVAGIFALGFFVVIASIIRAYYSKLNETMLTCTVSMVETAVALIATCLPALRTLILGQASRVGTSSAGRHYELSSHRAKISSRATRNESQHASQYGVGTQRKASESEDELFKEGISGPNSYTSLPLETQPKPMGGIAVTTEYQVHEEAAGQRNIVNF